MAIRPLLARTVLGAVPMPSIHHSLRTAAVAIALAACGRRGPAIVLDPPLDRCIRQAMPLPAATIDGLIPTAARRASLSSRRATSHGQRVWLLELGSTLTNQGQWARVTVRAESDARSTVCYLGDKKRAKDEFEMPSRTWVRFMAWLTALAAPIGAEL